jgi:hypothetical protein
VFEPEPSTRVDEDSSDHVAYMSLEEEEEDGQDYELEDMEDVYMDDQSMRKVGQRKTKNSSEVFVLKGTWQ